MISNNGELLRMNPARPQLGVSSFFFALCIALPFFSFFCFALLSFALLGRHEFFGGEHNTEVTTLWSHWLTCGRDGSNPGCAQRRRFSNITNYYVGLATLQLTVQQANDLSGHLKSDLQNPHSSPWLVGLSALPICDAPRCSM